MTFWTGKSKTREQVAGLERVVEEQASQLAEHRRIVAALVQQIDSIDRPLAEMTERVTSEGDAVRTTVASVGQQIGASRDFRKTFGGLSGLPGASVSGVFRRPARRPCCGHLRGSS